MTPVQIYTIINSMAEQSMGMKDLQATDSTFISIGKKVLSSETNVEAFYKTLVDRIGRTVMAIRTYYADMPAMAREPFEYGAILQKISFKMAKAQENPTWNSVTDTHSDPWEKTDAEFMQVFFDKWSTWEVPGTIADVQLETAFTGASAMAAFIDGIFQSMYNSLELAYENNGNLARASLIGAVMNTSSVAAYKINLLDDYNTETNASLTVAKALKDVDFLKYASMRMKLVSDQMVKPSVVFNQEGWERFTPKDRQVFEVNSNFAAILDTYLQSDTYHNDLTKLPFFTSVPYWQGSGTDWGFESTSAINVTIEYMDKSGATPVLKQATVSASNIIGVIRDIDSAGVTIDKRRTKSIYNPHDEYTNYWIKAEIGQFRDNSENCVVFYLAEV